MTGHNANIWTRSMWNIFKVEVEFSFSRTVYLQSCRQAYSSVKDKINIPLAYLKTFTGSCIILFKPNFCVVHATTNESRENHAIDFPIVHTSFWKPRPVFCFWQETQVRNCWCHFHCSMTDSATQKSVLVHYLPDSSLVSAFRKCFRNFTSTKQRTVFSPALS